MKSVQDTLFVVNKSDGDVIIKQGDDGDNFFCIDRGVVEIYIESNDGERSLVKTCTDGDSFGELAIMYNAPRAASCIAKGGCKLWAIDRMTFNVILMKTAMAKRNDMSTILLKIPIFKQLTQYELLTIADTLVEETFDDKAVLCNEGDIGDKFYLVHEGVAICTRQIGDDTVEVARLSSGSYLGEIALLAPHKQRQATVTASGTLKCFSLDRNAFNRVMGPLQESSRWYRFIFEFMCSI